ncbi:BTAD domain-containing putative transcriptional regulator [Nonomuraea mangrovi]|uniref:BTAD domain-containing putative transcriptional regulator n=1 Tax=Nonomuraea mangrovi TaxID=2316207 RepID=A0ABW4T653_9ACTN
MEIRLLGPLEVRDQQGALIPVTSAKQRVVLAALALRVRQVVQVEELIDCLWDESPPATARETVHSHVMRLRKALAGSGRMPLLTRAPGYLLDIEPDGIDLHRVQALRSQAEGRSPEGAATILREALDLWRGPMLADVNSAVLRSRHVRAWEDVWLQTMECHVRAELAMERHVELLGTLRSLVASHPLHEGFRGQLMTALSACGQRAEALREYDEARKLMVVELGIEPGRQLRLIHEQILGADTRPEPPPPPLPGPAAALLPLDVYGFVGREGELARLDAILAAAGRQPTAVVISALLGTAGVGKTALAVHWAHRVRDRFSDGQLYVNLRGFDPCGSPMSAAEAVRGFLDALGVAAERIPATLEAQVGLYRGLLAGQRVLIVLDNARDAEQVRPLLPSSPGCLVLVTSRNQLAGLVAAEGAHPLPLDLLPVAEAGELLARRLGAERVAAEPDAVEEIIARCARLPLALTIVAARAATYPGFPLAALAAELREAGGGLDVFDCGDPATQVRAMFSWSYNALTPGAARLFRLLGLHPGPDLALPAAQSLADVPGRQLRPLLAELIHAHLVVQHVPGRYALHDLLRAYAAELAGAREPEVERQAAVHRMLDHYVHSAHAATRLLNPHRDGVDPTPPLSGAVCAELADHDQALAWFTTEHAVLLAAITHASSAGFDGHTWHLAWTLADYLDRRGRWHDQALTQEAALDAARRRRDRLGQAQAHRDLGWAYTRLGRHDDGHAHFQLALELYGQLGDRGGQAHTHGNLSSALDMQGRYEEALDHAQQALALCRATGHRAGQARALNAVGWHHALLGDHHRALDYCEQALAVLEELGDRRGQAHVWDSLGYVHHHLGRHQRAIGCYQHARELFREAGHHYHEADTLTRLGDTHDAAGDLDVARHVWREALVILEVLGHPDADQVRAKLTDP